MKKLLTAFLLVLSLFACGGEEKKSDPLEIVGTYGDDFGGTHVITATKWDMAAMGKFTITKYDNADDFVIAQNDATNTYNPGKWSRMDWAWSGNDLYFCQTVYDKDSADEAEAATPADAEKLDTGCNGFGWTKLTPTTFAGAAGTTGSPAVAKDDPRITLWATGVATVEWGDNLTEEWKNTEKGLGPAEGTATDVVSLGDGGSITLTFDEPITDGDGPDIVVFENSFSDDFLELAFVEVSSDGLSFVRFAATYLGTEPVSEYGTLDPSFIDVLAGKYRAGWGVPFDLATLAVKDETVDLSAVSHVRIVDVRGDGSMTDSGGRPIYDPYPTHESAGFDLDAVGIIQ